MLDVLDHGLLDVFVLVLLDALVLRLLALMSSMYLTIGIVCLKLGFHWMISNTARRWKGVAAVRHLPVDSIGSFTHC